VGIDWRQSVHQPSVQFMTSVNLLHVPAPVFNPQVVFQIEGLQDHHECLACCACVLLGGHSPHVPAVVPYTRVTRQENLTLSAFHRMFIYDATCFGLTAIFRGRSNTVGRLRDRQMLENK
jgi:hypothetical protein